MAQISPRGTPAARRFLFPLEPGVHVGCLGLKHFVLSQRLDLFVLHDGCQHLEMLLRGDLQLLAQVCQELLLALQNIPSSLSVLQGAGRQSSLLSARFSRINLRIPSM